MSDYRRWRVAGGSYFFTVNLFNRKLRLLIERIDELRCAFHNARTKHSFHVDAIVILPEHLHCVWTLPGGDTDYSTRWRLIKAEFSRSIMIPNERRSNSRAKHGERGIWQRRFWEHVIRVCSIKAQGVRCTAYELCTTISHLCHLWNLWIDLSRRRAFILPSPRPSPGGRGSVERAAFHAFIVSAHQTIKTLDPGLPALR